jgi:hypothetical protein
MENFTVMIEQFRELVAKNEDINSPDKLELMKNVTSKIAKNQTLYSIMFFKMVNRF